MICAEPRERCEADFGLLYSHHISSFDLYHDPKPAGFSDLPGINDDSLKPGKSLETHPHCGMVISSLQMIYPYGMEIEI